MADVKCTICGHGNPADATFCENCGASLSKTGSSIQPGQISPDHATSELEPGLPDWLSDVRGQGNRPASGGDEMPSSFQSPPSGTSASDLLAGLQSQSADDEEEVPDWLADITGATSAKKKAQPEAGESRRVELGGPSQPAPAPEPEPNDEMPSWLSSLSSQGQATGQDDLGDWLRKADSTPAENPPAETGSAVGPFSGFAEPLTPSPAESQSDWLSSLQSEASISEEPVKPNTGSFGDVELPAWLKGEEPESPAPAASTAMPDWLKSMEAEAAAPPPSVEMPTPVDAGPFDFKAQEPEPASSAEAAPLDFEMPDWLKGMGPSEPVETQAAPALDTSDWLKGLDQPEPVTPATTPTSSDFEMPDWMKGVGASESAETQAAATLDTSDWLKGLDQPEPTTSSAMPTSSDFEMPDWMKGVGPSEPAEAQAAPAFDAPDWLKGMDQPSAPAQPESDFAMPDWLGDAKSTEQPSAMEPTSAPEPAFNVDLPDWLKGAGVKSDEPAKAEIPPAAPMAAAAATVASAAAFTDLPPEDLTPAAELPDWLSGLGKAPASDTSRFPTPETAIPQQIPEDMEELPPAEEPMSSGSLDSLFTEMPDWLSASAGSEQLPPSEEPDTTISPASLPSWVKAMRPVEAAMSGHAVEADEALETEGPLAGLHGVLPAVVYAGASSKPKPLAFKLQTDDEQQTQAALLEQILAAEARPEPMVTPARISSQRILRIVIAVLLLAVVTVGVVLGAQIFPMPLGRPAETMAAFNAVDAVIPPDAPVLVVFDYEPALAGEMEAAAAPLLDHLLVKQHPRLALLSTSPTGAALATRMFSGPLADLPGVRAVNLGYLPGGQTSIRAFASDPTRTATFPSDVSLFNLVPSPVWQSETLQGVQSLSNFAAIIVITDSAETGRTWIEQAGSRRGSAQFLVVSSAQAAPLFQPYYASGQINGLVSGLYDGAVLEQNNANRPGLSRRYWDAYNFSLILTLVLLTGGALWSLAAGLRERMTGRKAG